jgi:hypothetical protein
LLTGKRWQAGYDLAFGRATAMKARVDGNNAMLAALKRGKNFELDTSTFWVLRPADTMGKVPVMRSFKRRFWHFGQPMGRKVGV